jgi:hypothetical protein
MNVSNMTREAGGDSLLEAVLDLRARGLVNRLNLFVDDGVVKGGCPARRA